MILCSLYPAEDSPSAIEIRSPIIRFCLNCSDTDFPRFRTRHSALNPRIDYRDSAFVKTCNRVLVLVDPIRTLIMCIEEKLFSYNRLLFF